MTKEKILKHIEDSYNKTKKDDYVGIFESRYNNKQKTNSVNSGMFSKENSPRSDMSDNSIQKPFFGKSTNNTIFIQQSETLKAHTLEEEGKKQLKQTFKDKSKIFYEDMCILRYCE